MNRGRLSLTLTRGSRSLKILLEGNEFELRYHRLVSAVIFDLGGVLIDGEGLWYGRGAVPECWSGR